MLRKSKNVIGLDLGTSVVKAVEITLEGPEPVITGFARVEIPPGGSLADAVSAVFQEGNFRSRRVVTSVAGQSVVVRYLPMMKMSDAELRQAIRFETDKHLPFELDQVQMDCQALERAAPGAADGGASEGEQEDMTVLLAACKSDAIEEQVQLVISCGLTPVAIDVDLFALANAWELCGLPPEDDEAVSALALVDVGATRTSINVLCGGETCFSREVAIGGQDMTQAVARRLGIEPFEAEAIKRASESHEAEVNTAIAPVLEDLVSELSLSLDYVEHHSGVRVDEILLSGGGALAPGAAGYIEQATARRARAWNPLEGLRVDASRVDVEELEAWASTLVVAVGLATRARTL
ncbi:MAG TPA: type IV pilus assembly protein PilM [Planctomycetota bacterium]|nr:type IV pilus assembly protein PilM [Planctomycetota bacterium]